MTIYDNYLKSFLSNGESFLNTLQPKELADWIFYLDDRYYNFGDSIGDNIYDIIKSFTITHYPDLNLNNKIGAKIPDDASNKVTLPFNMPSMDKIKPDSKNSLSNWLLKYKGNYIISCKLDGISALVYTTKHKQQLFTRGDGTIGQDISHLLPFLNIPNLQHLINESNNLKYIAVRGELIMDKNTFNTKYSKDFANARNLVGGIVNKKSVSPFTHDVHFVAYERIDTDGMLPSKQLQSVHDLGFETVKYSIHTSINNDLLSDILIHHKENYEYVIDGIIITDNNVHPRINGNPDHSFAFKMILRDNSAEVTVVDVIWNASKYGTLKPKIKIEPVYLEGSNIEFLTGKNAKFIYNNKIGVGSIIEIYNNIVPNVKQVIVPALIPKMPTVNYEWDGVDVVLSDMTNNEDVNKNCILYFFKELKVENLGEGVVNKLYSSGYKTIGQIVQITTSELEQIEGFGQISASKLVSSIKNQINNCSLDILMSASNMFGQGISIKKIQSILNDYPNVLTDDIPDTNKINKLLKIKGIADKTATLFVNSIPNFMNFIQINKLSELLNSLLSQTQNTKLKNNNINSFEEDVTLTTRSNNNTNNTNNNIVFKTAVLTGTRDKELLKKLESENYKIVDTVNKNVNLVIAKDPNENTKKIKDALKYNIPILSIDEFLQQ